MASNATESIEQRTEIRQRNKNPAASRAAFAAQSLKFDIKKATALAKRFGDYSVDASEKTILSQLSSISFGKFLSEAVQGVVASLCKGTKMRTSDAHSFAVVCSGVHQRYEDFWPSVQQGLRKVAGKILDVEALRAEIERVEETAASASAAAPGSSGAGPSSTAAAVDLLGSAAAPAQSSVNANAPGTNTGGSAASGASAVASPPALEELARLRLIARVFCEWFLLGLLDDASFLQKVLKLVNVLLSRRRPGNSGTTTAAVTSPTVVSNLVAVAVVIVREVGIELIGSANAALPLLFPADENNARVDAMEQLRALAGQRGALAPSSDSNETENVATNIIQLGPAGVRVVFSATIHSAVPVDDAALRNAAEISIARLRDAKDHSAVYAFGTIEDQRQFVTLVLSIARTAVAVYERCRTRVQGAWQRLAEQEELRGRTARLIAAEAQFRAYHEEVERLYAQLDALLGMMGYSAPEPIDLSRAAQKNTTDATSVTLHGRFAPGEAETINRFVSGEQRLFYENIPRLQAIPEEMLSSLAAQKANFDLFTRRHNNNNNNNSTGKHQSRNARVDDKTCDDAAFRDSIPGKDDDDYCYDNYCYDDDDDNKDEKTVSVGKQTPAEITAARRRRHMSELGISPAEYTHVLQLLDNFEQCVTPASVDEWCEGFFQEALRPLCRAENEQGVSAGRVFFTNCRVLLALELRHFPVARWPDMLPYAARCAAIVHQYFPDTSEFIARSMVGMWRGPCQKGPGTEVPSGIGESLAQRRVAGAVRYLCELMKFGVSPPIHVLTVVRTAAENLQHRLVASAVAAAIEHGGLFLLRGSVTRPVMEGHIKKLRSSLQHVVLDEDALDLVKASFAALQPPAPTVQRPVQKIRPPLEEYARHLIFNKLSRDKYETVLEKMLRMPWEDPDAANALERTLRKVHRLAWDAVPHLADLLAEITFAGHTQAAQYVMDSLVEDMRRDLEFTSHLLATKKASSAPRASVAVEDQRLHPVILSSLPTCHRPMQQRLVDCEFIAQLYRARLVNLRFVTLALLILLRYAPSPTPVSDCGRARCFVTLLGSCIEYLTWRSFPYGGAVERPRSSSPSKPHLARLRWSVDRIVAQQQIVRRLVAQLFVHIHEDIAGPLPFDLRFRVEELVESVNEAVHQLYEEASDETNGSEIREILGEVPPPPPLVLPETPEAARAFATDVVDAEPLHSINKWYAKTYSTIASAGTTPPFRLSTDIFGTGPPPGGQPAAPLGLVRDGTSSGYVSADNDDEHRMEDEESDDEEDDDVSNDDEDEDDEDDDDDEEEEEEDEEEYDEDDEEDDDEEEEEEDEEDDDDDEDEEEEDEPNPMQRDAVAAALRKQQEEEEFDAELLALRMETTRTAPAKSIATKQIIEKELASGIRQHQQRQRQQQQQQQKQQQQEQQKGEGNEGNMMRFAVLQRQSGKASAGAAQAAPVLCLPRDLQFVQSAAEQHEKHRQHKEELRAITVRMNRRQEEESSDASRDRKK